MNLIMRVFGHYEPLETPNLIMIVSLIIRCIMRLLGFQCGVSNDVPTHRTVHQHHRTQLIVLVALRLHLQVEVVSAGVVGGEEALAPPAQLVGC